jgi:hypothetical protein
MDKFLLFWFYIACMLGMSFLFASAVLGSFKLAWRYLGTLTRHIAALAALAIVLAGSFTLFQ